MIANVIALPGAWYVRNAWLQNFAYRTNITGWTFVAAGSMVPLTALLTVNCRSVTAALAYPIESLRYEQQNPQ